MRVAISDMRAYFTTRPEGVMAPLRTMTEEVPACVVRVTQAEQRISETDDKIGPLQSQVEAVKEKTATLERQHVFHLVARFLQLIHK